MSVQMRLAALLCITAGLALGDNWSGYLVNSSCYESLENNHNPHDTETYVDRDRGAEVRYCAPNAKTKSFAVVEQDGEIFTLDPAGNLMAAGLVKQSGKKSLWPVNVSGERQRGEVKVSSISLGANPGQR